MSTKKVSINEFIENPELLEDNCWGFYDWFCSDKSLENKARGFIPKLKFLVKEGLINSDTHYVWFKNNCPMVGNLYDDMRISDLEGNYKLYICPKSGHNASMNEADILFLTNDSEEFNFKNWGELKKELKTNKELINIFKKHML